MRFVIYLLFGCCLFIVPAQGKDIVWVSDLKDGLEWDFEFLELLEAAGHTVDPHYDDYRDIGPDEIDLMNQSDLVILSRSGSSGNYGGEIEKADNWNSVETPLLLLSPWLTRTNRWLWFDSGTANIDTLGVLVASDPGHPIFGGVTTPVDMWDPERLEDGDLHDVGIVTTDAQEAGNGTVLATTESGEVWIAYWDQGVEFFNGSGQDAGGNRMYFTLGNHEPGGSSRYGGNNSTPEADTLFLNAVNFMVGELGGKPKLQAGDADQDLDFDQLDLVKVQIAAKYLTGAAATWGEGDWDTAPGGEPGSPPAGNGTFDQLDIIAALAPGHYLTGPYAALTLDGNETDEQTSLVYDVSTGELKVDAPTSTNLTSINIDSADSKFIGDKSAVLDGAFDNFAADNIFKATFGGSFGDISFGNVLPAGISEADVAADLTAVGSLEGGGALGNVDLVYIPEPSAILLMVLGLLGFSGRMRQS